MQVTDLMWVSNMSTIANKCHKQSQNVPSMVILHSSIAHVLGDRKVQHDMSHNVPRF